MHASTVNPKNKDNIMIKFEVTIIIHRPLEDVFRFVAQGENGSKWNSAVKEVKQISEGPVGVGTRY